MAVGHMRSRIGLVANWDQHLDTSVESMARKMRARNPGGGLTDADRRALDAAETDADRCVYGEVKAHPLHPGRVQSLDDIRIFAYLAEGRPRPGGARGGPVCGNCGEQAARVFMFLYDLGLRPLDYVIALPARVDHAFVVLGREYDTTDWTKWGKSAVVCDPWAEGLLKSKSYDRNGGAYGDFYSAYEATFLGFCMRQMFPGFQGVQFEHTEL
jgi:hypothetical protein